MMNPLWKGKQMWAVTTLACAPFTVGAWTSNEYRAGSGCSYRVSQEAFERLEPCAVKIARTVLRGRERSNPLLLPDLGRALI